MGDERPDTKSQAQLRDDHVALSRALCAFGRFRKRWAFLAAAARLVVVAPGALLVWFLLDWWLKLPDWPLFISFVLIACVGLWAAVWWVLPALLRRIRPEREALAIESLHSRLDNQLIGALQLGDEVLTAERTGEPLGYSPALVRALVARTVERWADLRAHKLVDLRAARIWVAAAAVVAIAWAGSAVFAGRALAARAERLHYAYLTVLDAVFPVQMEVSPKDVTLVRGEPVTLGVKVIGARRRDVKLVRTDAGNGETLTNALTLSERQASYAIEHVAQSFSYRFEYGRLRSPAYRVLVGDLPKLEAINYELMYPAYTGQPPRTLVGRVSRLRGLAGTGVLVSFAATTALHPEYCYVEWQDGARQAVTVNGRFGHFSFTIARPDRATVYLFGTLGRKFAMEQPLSFEVDMQKDEPPTVDVLLKQKKLTMLVEEGSAFGLNFLAEDDFGVAEVSVQYRIEALDSLLGRQPRSSAASRVIDPPRDRVKDKFLELLKNLSPPLEPGDRVTITVTATDNNTETGPGVGRSQPIEIVIVRPDLGEFVEKQFGFDVQSALGGLHKVKRETDLLVSPVRTVRTEAKHPVERQALKARVSQESWPGGAEDAVADYVRLLSGED